MAKPNKQVQLCDHFQITIPFHEAGNENGEQWASFESARENIDNKPPNNKFNEMPECQIRQKFPFAHGFGGDTDVSGDVDPTSMGKGYERLELGSTDDEYSGQCIDLFYGKVEDEKGNEGFLERNNYLDRH